MAEQVVRQLVRHRGGEFVFGVVETDEFAAEQHAPPVGDRAIADPGDFEVARTGGGAFDRRAGEVIVGAAMPAEIDPRIALQQQFDRGANVLHAPPCRVRRLVLLGDGKTVDRGQRVAGCKAAFTGGRAFDNHLREDRTRRPRHGCLRVRIGQRILPHHAERGRRILAIGGIGGRQLPAGFEQSAIEFLQLAIAVRLGFVCCDRHREREHERSEQPLHSTSPPRRPLRQSLPAALRGRPCLRECGCRPPSSACPRSRAGWQWRGSARFRYRPRARR